MKKVPKEQIEILIDDFETKMVLFRRLGENGLDVAYRYVVKRLKDLIE